MKTLRQINNDIEQLCLETPYEDDDSEQEIEAELKMLNLEFDEKLEAIGNVRMEQKAYIKRLRAEKARLDKEIASVESRGKWLDFYCMAEMLRAGVRNFTGKFLKLTIAKSPVSAEVATNPDDGKPRIEDIDPRFVKEVVSHKVDKSEAIRHYKQTGEVPEGFRIVDNLEHLRIR